MTALPSLFVSHGGGPCFFMDWEPPDTWTALANALRGLPATLPQRPRAVLWISAHWEAPQFTVTAHPQPALIYDYHGFPPHTYTLQYPAPGEPMLAQRVVDLLWAAGLPAQADARRGFDHGVFVPGLLMFPEADLPMVQLSLRTDLDAAAHLACGAALAPLRDEGVLIIGSGYSYHNLRQFAAAGAEPARQFDAWLQDTVTGHSGAARQARLQAWAQAPAAHEAHPREEHLLPLMVAAAAAADAPGSCSFSQPVWQVQTSNFRFG